MGSTGSTKDVPVIIVGGGCCGLLLSCFLSNRGIKHILFEKHPGTSILPKASYLNPRTLEILRQQRLYDRLAPHTSPLRNLQAATFQTSLAGTGPLDKKLFARVLRKTAVRDDSPHVSTQIPLVRSEPIWRAQAEELNPGNILFSHRVVDFAEEGDQVLVTVTNAAGATEQYRCSYLVGADGGKMVGGKIGAVMEGVTDLADMVSLHFKADFSEYWDDRVILCHFTPLDTGTITGGGVLIPIGPTWGRYSEEWNLHFGFGLDDPRRFDDPVPAMRKLLKLPDDLQVEVLNSSHWTLEGLLASKYRQGRVLLAGDACHKRPPTSGLGLNTSIDDAYSLAWKLAAVINGKAHTSLLDTYEMERRPRGKATRDWALLAFGNRVVLDAAIGLRPNSTEANSQRAQQLFDGSDTGRYMLNHIQNIVDSQNIEFSARNIELGYYYEHGAVIADGTPPPAFDPTGKLYVPTTRPGHRLPHAWLGRGRDEKVSTHDILRFDDDFAVLTDEQGDAWVTAATKYAKDKGLNVTCATIRSEQFASGAEYLDWDNKWETLREFQNGGAILLRPDNFVGWRSIHPTTRGGEEIAEAMEMLLWSRDLSKAIPMHTGLAQGLIHRV